MQSQLEPWSRFEITSPLSGGTLAAADGLVVVRLRGASVVRGLYRPGIETKTAGGMTQENFRHERLKRFSPFFASGSVATGPKPLGLRVPLQSVVRPTDAKPWAAPSTVEANPPGSLAVGIVGVKSPPSKEHLV